MGGIILLTMAVLIIAAIVFGILCFRSFKKRKNKKALIYAFIGLIMLTPPVILTFRLLSVKNIVNLLGEYNFVKEFTQINQGFSHTFNSDKKSVAGINVEINGFVNGKGKLSIICPPFEDNNGIILELERNVNENIKNIDWYNSGCLIEFIPENEFVDGKILVKIKMY